MHEVSRAYSALGEALSHLQYLEGEGRAARTVDADGVHRFSKA
jgi:hypothetical protein